VGRTDQTDQANRASPEYFEVAKQAAARGEPHRMLEALALSGFLDGLVRSLNTKWDRMPEDEVKDCIALAVDSAYQAIFQGRSVRDLAAWLWKAADNTVNDRWNDYYQARAPVEAADSVAAVDQNPHDEAAAQLAEHRRAEAIRLARQLIPRIGQGQVVAVMGVVIDAVEQGIPDLPHAAIADALGLTEPAVRSLLSRGFDRLAREARREGIELPDDLPDLMGQPKPEGETDSRLRTEPED